MINENVVKGQWKMIKGDLQRRWGVLTNDDLDRAKGSVTVLEGLLQKKLGISQEQAHEQLDTFLEKYNKDEDEDESDIDANQVNDDDQISTDQDFNKKPY